MKPLDKNIYNFEAQTIAGEAIKFSKFQGRVLLIVNVASECRFTPQYSGLQNSKCAQITISCELFRLLHIPFPRGSEKCKALPTVA